MEAVLNSLFKNPWIHQLIESASNNWMIVSALPYEKTKFCSWKLSCRSRYPDSPLFRLLCDIELEYSWKCLRTLNLEYKKKIKKEASLTEIHHNLFITLLFGPKAETVLDRKKQKTFNSKTKMFGLYRKNDHLWSFFCIIYTFLGSIFVQCYIQNHVIMNSVIKRFGCIEMENKKIGSTQFPWYGTFFSCMNSCSRFLDDYNRVTLMYNLLQEMILKCFLICIHYLDKFCLPDKLKKVFKHVTC